MNARVWQPSHDEFMKTLPHTPLAQHIEQLDIIMLNLGVMASSPFAVDTVRHCLHEIAAYTSVPISLREGIRREVLDELGLPPGYTGPAMPNPFFGAVKALKEMGENLRRNLNPVSEEEIEAAKARRYERQIENERQTGLAFVRREAKRVRKELGL